MDTTRYSHVFRTDILVRDHSRPISDDRPSESEALYNATKRMVDVVIGLMTLFLTLPLILVVALSVRWTSRGPVIFCQKRLGINGREFWCLKFRTMREDAEEILRNSPELQQQFEDGFKLKHDPRITPIGSFLRRSSLDELPQLINIIRGDISLVGPRPIVPPEIEKYGPYASELLRVKPGLSGLWQVSGRSETTYAERVQMDMRYIRERCLSLDLMILWRTVGVVLFRRGAY